MAVGDVAPGPGRSAGRPSLRAKALAWLAQREHSRQELAQKLQRWARQQADEPASVVAQIEPLLDALEAAGHLSDQRFAESRINARSARYGNRRIEQELRSKGAALDESQRDILRASELERARAVWRARFGQAPADAREHARQLRFMAGRGFSADTLKRLLREPDGLL